MNAQMFKITFFLKIRYTPAQTIVSPGLASASYSTGHGLISGGAQVVSSGLYSSGGYVAPAVTKVVSTAPIATPVVSKVYSSAPGICSLILIVRRL